MSAAPRLRDLTDWARLVATHWRAFRRASAAEGPRDDMAREILVSGIAVRPGFVDRATADAWRDALPPLDRFARSPEGTETRYIDWAYDIPALRAFYDDARVERTMRELLGDRTVRLRCTAQERHVVGNVSFENFFHIDTWLPRFKAFLFLCDVTPENGPLVYVPGSHRGWWRFRLERQVQRDFVPGDDGYIDTERSAYTGCLFPHQAERIFRATGLTPRTVLVPAGTLVVLDGRGLHRATRFVAGRRLMLSSYWIEPGRHN
jgi:hypothetical protein